MTTFGERLKKERERLAMSQTALAGIGGVGKTTQINYEKDNRSPDAAYLSALAAVGVDVQFLLTGNRSVAGSQSATSATSPSHGSRLLSSDGSPEPGYSAVPMYDIEAAAGTGRIFDAETIESTLYFETAQLEAEGLDPAQIVGAKVRGDSMGETLRDGDQVLVDRSHRTPDGVFLLRMGDELRIKRVQRVAGGALMLISDNTHYPPELVKPEDLRDVEILGRCEIRIGRVS